MKFTLRWVHVDVDVWRVVGLWAPFWLIWMAYKRIMSIIEMAWPKDDTHERHKWCDDDDAHYTEFHYDLFVIEGLWEPSAYNVSSGGNRR